jgi:hypothetical protein
MTPWLRDIFENSDTYEEQDYEKRTGNTIMDNSLLRAKVDALRSVVSDRDRVILDAFLSVEISSEGVITHDEIAAKTGRSPDAIRMWCKRFTARYRQAMQERNPYADEDAEYREQQAMQREQKRNALQVQLDRITSRDTPLSELPTVEEGPRTRGASSRRDPRLSRAIILTQSTFPTAQQIEDDERKRAERLSGPRWITWDPSTQPGAAAEEAAMSKLKAELKSIPIAFEPEAATTKIISTGYLYPLQADYNPLDSTTKYTEPNWKQWVLKPIVELSKDEVSDYMARGFIRKKTVRKKASEKVSKKKKTTGEPEDYTAQLEADERTEQRRETKRRIRDPRPAAYNQRSVDGD